MYGLGGLMNIGDGPNINMQQKVNTEPRSCYIKNIYVV